MDKKKLLNTDDVIALLKEKQGKMHGYELANKIGISPSHLSEIYKKKREINSEEVLAFLGLKREVFFAIDQG